jgi:hypothetical protein
VRLAFGLKAHSGWAALVAIGAGDGGRQVVDRRRMELVDDTYARAPYHAAEGLPPAEAAALVERAVQSAGQVAVREMKAACRRAREAGHWVAACAVLVGAPMPSFTVEEIRAVHFRMHQAEGFLFRDVLLRAARACELEALEIREKSLAAEARTLGMTDAALARTLAALGKSVGPPWGKDQKDAALAALIALDRRHRRAATLRPSDS